MGNYVSSCCTGTNYYYSVYIKYLNMNKQEAIKRPHVEQARITITNVYIKYLNVNTQEATIPSEHEYTRGNNSEWKLPSW